MRRLEIKDPAKNRRLKMPKQAINHAEYGFYRFAAGTHKVPKTMANSPAGRSTSREEALQRSFMKIAPGLEENSLRNSFESVANKRGLASRPSIAYLNRLRKPPQNMESLLHNAGTVEDVKLPVRIAGLNRKSYIPREAHLFLMP